MQTFRSLLLCLFIALQAIAPLLHAHMGEAPGNGKGVHLAGLSSVDGSAADAFRSAAPRETPVVDLCDQFRRNSLDVPAPPAGSMAIALAVPQPAQCLDALAAPTALPKRAAPFIRPFSQAPPNLPA